MIELNKQRKDWAAAVDSLERLGALQQGEEAIETAFATAKLAEESLGDPARAEMALRRAYGLDPSSQTAREALKAHYEKHAQPERLAEMLVLDERDATDPKEKVAMLKRIADIYATQLANPA